MAQSSPLLIFSILIGRGEQINQSRQFKLDYPERSNNLGTAEKITIVVSFMPTRHNYCDYTIIIMVLVKIFCEHDQIISIRLPAIKFDKTSKSFRCSIKIIARDL